MPETMKVKMMKLRAMKGKSGVNTVAAMKMTRMKAKGVPAGMHRMPDGRLMKGSKHGGGMLMDTSYGR